MKRRIFFLNRVLLIVIPALFSGCHDQNTASLDDLSTLKNDFIDEILQGAVEESPFSLSYHLRTVFYSKQVVSLFGKLHQYSHLPHGWTKYEGRTFYKMNGKFIPLVLNDLISTKKGWEFIRNYCENVLKNDPCSYFSGEKSLRTALKFEDLNTFALDDQSLILIFQPYIVAGGTDDPPFVKIPWVELLKIITPTHPIYGLLKETVRSKDFISSWDGSSLERSLKDCVSQGH